MAKNIRKIRVFVSGHRRTASSGRSSTEQRTHRRGHCGNLIGAQNVQAVQRALADLEPLSYNVYNLLLQSGYEEKETRWKKALHFDGFPHTSGIASKSPELAHRGGMLLDGKEAERL